MNENNGRSRILELRARNVKSIKEVEIDMAGDIHEIRGDTGQGKTSVLSSIEGALRGLDPDMVRRGASKAELELRLSTATIKRIVPSDGSRETLLVTDAGGNGVERAKDFLQTICGPSTFRPIQWVQLGGGDARGRTERLRRQRDQLLEAIPLALTERDVFEAVKGLGPECVEALSEVNLDGVDFEQHPFVVCSAIERACYDFRKLQNAKADDAEAVLQHTPAPETPAPRADLATCQAREREAVEAYHSAEGRLRGRKAVAGQRDTLKAKIDAEAAELPDPEVLRRTAGKWIGEKADAEKEIQRLEALLKAQRERLVEADEKVTRCEGLANRLAAQEARERDLGVLELELQGEGLSMGEIEELRKAMHEAQADTEARRLQDVHDVAAKTANDARLRAELFDSLVALFRDGLPKKLLGEAELPVKGLSVDEKQVLIDGIPLHQLGTSQQIRVGVLIAAALNPRSGFVLVDGAESLGRKDRVALAEAARELGLQVVLTLIDESAVPSEHVTVMKDGQAVPQDEKAPCLV